MVLKRLNIQHGRLIKMKKLLTAGLLSFVMAGWLQGQPATVNVQAQFQDFGMTPQYVRRVTLTPTQPFGQSTNVIFVPVPTVRITDTNGSVWFSNQLSGYSYTLKFDLTLPYPPPISITITDNFPPGLTGNVNAATYLTNTTSTNFGTNLFFLNGNNVATGTNLFTASNNFTGGLYVNGVAVSTNSVSGFQTGSQNLTNWSQFNTNQFASTNQLASGTNGAAITATNSIRLFNSLPSIRSFGALGNGNDDTAAIQAAAYAGGASFPESNDPTNIFTVTGTIFLTNNTAFIGTGNSIIQLQPTFPIAGPIMFGTNNITNVVLQGIVFDGANYGRVSPGNPPYSFFNSNKGVKQDTSTFINRSGLFIYAFSSDSRIQNCGFIGFSDSGARFYGAGGFNQPTRVPIAIVDCWAENSWEGFKWTNGAEYMHPQGLATANCGVGLDIQSGNLDFVGGQDTKDGIAVWVHGDGLAPNAGSAAIHSRTMNHNYISVQANDFAGRFFFDGLTMQGGVAILLTNTSGVVFQNSLFGSGGGDYYANVGYDFIVDGGSLSNPGMNWFLPINNMQQFCFYVVTNTGHLSFSANDITNQTILNGTAAPYTNGYYNRFTGNNTFSGGSNSFTGNGSGVTNVPISGLNTNGSSSGFIPYSLGNIVVWSNAPAAGTTPTFGNQFGTAGGLTNFLGPTTNLANFGQLNATNASGNTVYMTNGSLVVSNANAGLSGYAVISNGVVTANYLAFTNSVAPTLTTNGTVAGGGAGAGAVFSIDAAANDTRGRITIVTATAAANLLAVTLTFSKTLPNVPEVYFLEPNSASGGVSPVRFYFTNVTTASAQIFSTAISPSSTTTNTYHYFFVE